MRRMMGWAATVVLASAALAACTNEAENRGGGDGRGTLTSEAPKNDGEVDIDIEERPEDERVRSHRVEGGSEPGAGDGGGPGSSGGGGAD